MSSILRKRKRDGVTSGVDDGSLDIKHKKSRRGDRKAKPKLDAEQQKDSAGSEVKEISRDDGPSSPPKEHPVIPEASHTERKASTKKAKKSKGKHDVVIPEPSSAEQQRDQEQDQRQDHPSEKEQKENKKSEEQVKNIEGGSKDEIPGPRTGPPEKGKHPFDGDPAWSVSQALGGRLIGADPLVTDDEKYLILAYPSALNVYATKSSSLIRSLPITNSNSKDAIIAAYALSPTQPTNLYAATYKGILYLFDWVEGKKLGRWKFGRQVYSLAVSTQNFLSKGPEDVVYARENTGEKWRISAHRLKRGSDADETESKTIYTSKSPITQFKVIRDGKLILASSGYRLIIGELKGDSLRSLNDMEYVWREVDTPGWISSIGVRLSENISSKDSGSDDTIIDVVLGHAQGTINVYYDLFNNLVRQERQKEGLTTSHLSPRRMHWHREDVLSVKWSSDGNYIISGGLETVLVFWQLDTDKLDFLPHLSAPIENIVVAPTGTSYIIRLSDNSIMMLSSSELKAKVYVGGIQAEALRQHLPLASSTMKKINRGYDEDDPSNMPIPFVPATISGLNPAKLLLAVPSSASPYSSEGSSNGCPYLQTIDLATAHHISRQALTRTNATNVNIGPESNKLVEPTVTFICASHDGRWLATVDEWSPPRRDIEPLVANEDELYNEIRRRTEIFLRFWSWNSTQKEWELVTRVDGPHSTADSLVGNGRILDLQTDPVSLGFSTVGEDGIVRIWTSTQRRRDNMVLYDKNSQPLMEWSCHRVIRLGKTGSSAQLEQGRTSNGRSSTTTAARLAFSFDGSVLAASQSSLIVNDNNISGTVHFIDPNTGDVRQTQAGAYKGVLISLAFVERYLVIIADNLVVWDTVQDCLSYGYSLSSRGVLLPHQKIALTHFAVDHSQGTFAVSFPVCKSKLTRQRLKEARSEILIFDPKSPIPLRRISLPHLVTALVPLVDSTGYVVLDSVAELRMISHKSSSLAISMSDKDMKDRADNEREGERPTVATSGDEEEEDIQRAPSTQIISGDTLNVRQHDDNGNVDDDDDDDGPPVIRQEQLTEIFDVGPAYSLPPLHDLFGQVAELFSRKPLFRREKVAA
ncbi:MAG: hypothetical protein M1816_006700 [Peltula sp. TS41687]|nr:MAG: hypothetical protein M1816_006700 [Peltula sp. TS41687]